MSQKAVADITRDVLVCPLASQRPENQQPDYRVLYPLPLRRGGRSALPVANQAPNTAVFFFGPAAMPSKSVSQGFIYWDALVVFSGANRYRSRKPIPVVLASLPSVGGSYLSWKVNNEGGVFRPQENHPRGVRVFVCLSVFDSTVVVVIATQALYRRLLASSG